ncbi:MAG: 3-dehydroquinate synthase [Flavobacteriales bacterium]|nr:MAG: 3-dehydroquinate synthase [Flavobacteriales bacterium]
MNLEKIQASDYPIFIGRNVFVEFHEFLVTNYAKSKKFILVDENTHRHCLKAIDLEVPHLQNAEIIAIDSGEENKKIEVAIGLWETLIDRGADRQSLLINLGGGVIGDLGGFVASTFKRGIDFINLPTTLLAMVDASVGGKVGIDFQHLKNQIGVFSNPKAVFIYPKFLKTLDRMHLLSGFAEAIKHALIYDAEFWEDVQKAELTNRSSVTKIILHSVEIKNDIVNEDWQEKGARKTLNFGHTIGHAIESYFLEEGDSILHGEAVAIGIVCEAYISHKTMGMSEKQLEVITSFINANYEHYSFSQRMYHRFIELMKSDKKNQHGQINFTLLKEIGQAEINQTCKSDTIIEALDYYRSSAI